MYGAPDDMSAVSNNNQAGTASMDFSDSDILRDAKHVQWRPFPNIPDTAQPSFPSRETLIDPDITSSSTKSGRGMRNVKAKLKAVARFLSYSSKESNDGDGLAVSRKGLPISGQSARQLSEPINKVVTPVTHHQYQQAELRNAGRQQSQPDPHEGAPRPTRYVSLTPPQLKVEPKKVIDTLRERLDDEQQDRLPPPPPPPTQPPSPLLAPPKAMPAKKRYPSGPEAGIFSPRPTQPRMRSATPHPAMPPPGIRVASRPLPPTPAFPHQNHQEPPRGLGLTLRGEPATKPQTITFGDIVVNTRNEQPHHQLERFPSKSYALPIDPNKLAEELESLASYNSHRSRRERGCQAPSPAETLLADSSREAVCHWNPAQNPTFQVWPPVSAHASSNSTSLIAEQSEESEAVQRINQWRVKITTPPSVTSHAVSAHSFVGEEEVSSHLTSVSRSPLSKKSSEDPERTPTLQAKRVVLGREQVKSYKVSPGKPRTARNGSTSPSAKASNKGTSHIARLSDSQFERLARATEGPSPPPPAPVPVEKPELLQPNHDDERRSSLDATGTTLSVLEQKASQHLETLDQMIKRHPNKMMEVFNKRPGLLLVVLLRCKIEDRISEVQADPVVDLAPTKSDYDKHDGIDLLEESLIDLRFDDEPLQPQVPSIVVSHHQTSSSVTDLGRVDAAVMAELDTGTEQRLEHVVARLEQAGELCSMQHLLVALQERLMGTKDNCRALESRLSAVSMRCEILRKGRKRKVEMLTYSLPWDDQLEQAVLSPSTMTSHRSSLLCRGR